MGARHQPAAQRAHTVHHRAHEAGQDGSLVAVVAAAALRSSPAAAATEPLPGSHLRWRRRRRRRCVPTTAGPVARREQLLEHRGRVWLGKQRRPGQVRPQRPGQLTRAVTLRGRGWVGCQELHQDMLSKTVGRGGRSSQVGGADLSVERGDRFCSPLGPHWQGPGEKADLPGSRPSPIGASPHLERLPAVQPRARRLRGWRLPRAEAARPTRRAAASAPRRRRNRPPGGPAGRRPARRDRPLT